MKSHSICLPMIRLGATKALLFKFSMIRPCVFDLGLKVYVTDSGVEVVCGLALTQFTVLFWRGCK